MSTICFKNVTFSYEGSFDTIFENLNLQIDTSWKLGLIGRNGRGKTTLLKLLTGEESGSGTIISPVACTYFPSPVRQPQLICHELAQALCPGLEEWRLEREISLLDMKQEVLTRPYQTLSNGERTKLLLAILFLKENNYLLIDEPTNHLDLLARQKVADYLNKKSGFLLVSHDRVFLDSCTDHILALNRTGQELIQGNFSTYWLNKKRREQFEQTQNTKLQKEIARLERSAAQTAAWSDRVEKTKKGQKNSGLRPDRGYLGHKSAKMMKRSLSAQQSKEKAAQEKKKLLLDVETAEELKLHPIPFAHKKLLEARDLTLFYSGRQVCGPVHFTLLFGQRLAVTGKNGCGKSTLLHLLEGDTVDFDGTLFQAKGLKISTLPQDPSFLSGDLLTFAGQHGLDVPLFLAILRKLDFSREQFGKNMADYSFGQKKKVLLAKSLCESAHLYLWDEPLNYIDLYSRMQVERLLLEYRPTMVFVEHDAAFTEAIATQRLSLS